MNLLLDTHVFIWMATAPEKLSLPLRDHLRDSANQIFLSVASMWEMQIKYQTGRLMLPANSHDFVATQVRLRDIRVLPIQQTHVWMLDNLPFHHRDPFDRLLVAQAIVEGYTLASVDAIFEQYAVDLFR